MALGLQASGGHRGADVLPVCSNRVINEVVKRAGCTLGDTQCWIRQRGFCGDHVEARVKADLPAKARLERLAPEQVREGDVALFASRAHYAYVERVARDEGGRPVAVDVSEYNFGTCWVDRVLLVTDRYGILSRRRGIALGEVDGGFLRPTPISP